MSRDQNFDRTPPFDILWVAEKCGLLSGKVVQHGGEINVRCPLPGCGDKATHLALNVQKNVWNCPRCGRGGSMRDLYALLGKSYEMDKKEAGRELFALWRGEHADNPEEVRLRDERRKKRMEQIQEQAPREIAAPIEVRNAAYQALLDCLPGLTEAHMENLLNRGLTQEDIDRLGLKSFVFPRWITLRAPKKLDTYGVAGFYTSEKDKRRYVNTDHQGIMIPYRDLYGRIGMIEIRLFGEKQRYLRFSSGKEKEGRTGRSKSVSTVHHVGIDPENPPKKVYLTEGGLKADVANALSGMPFIAMAGVNNPCGLKETLEELKAIGVEQICVAFDMDLYKNPNVLRGLKNVWTLILAAGLKVSYLRWTTEYKGIDDYLWAKIQAEANIVA